MKLSIVESEMHNFYSCVVMFRILFFNIFLSYCYLIQKKRTLILYFSYISPKKNMSASFPRFFSWVRFIKLSYGIPSELISVTRCLSDSRDFVRIHEYLNFYRDNSSAAMPSACFKCSLGFSVAGDTKFYLYSQQQSPSRAF